MKVGTVLVELGRETINAAYNKVFQAADMKISCEFQILPTIKLTKQPSDCKILKRHAKKKNFYYICELPACLQPSEILSTGTSYSYCP